MRAEFALPVFETFSSVGGNPGGERGAQHLAHPRPMRALPIDAPAARAAHELGVALNNTLGDVPLYCALFNGFEARVAMQTQCEWLHVALEAIACRNFPQL